MTMEPHEAAVRSLVEEVERRLEPHAYGGRATSSKWTEREYVMFKRQTLDQLALLASRVSEHGLRVEPMQIAALIVELVVEDMSRR